MLSYTCLGLNKISKGLKRQILIAFLGSVGAFCGGCAFSWLTPFILRLTSAESVLPMHIHQVSLVMSALDLGSLLSPLPAGVFANIAGRKPVLVLAGPLFITSWALVISTRSFGVLYFIRVVQGLGVGIVFSVLPMYLGEMAGPGIRGTLGLFTQGMTTAGMLFEYIIGPFTSYSDMAWISLTPTLIFFIAIPWFPESPYFLVMRGKDEKALQALAWFRGEENPEAVSGELDEIRKSVEEDQRNEATWKDLVLSPEGRKSIFLVEALLVLYGMGGAISCLNYSSLIFNRAEDNTLSSQISPIILGVFILLLFPVPIFSIERLGRRPILIVSSVIAVIFHILSGTYYFLRDYTSVNLSHCLWLPYLSVITATVVLVVGVESIKHVLQAELFPNSTRGLAAGVVILSERSLAIISITIFPVITVNHGMYLNFYIFAFFSALGAVFIYLYLPETKGKTLLEIQKSLQVKENSQVI